MEVGQLWVKLGLDKSGFNNGVNEAKNQSGGLGGFIKNAFAFTVGQGIFDTLKVGIKSAWDMSIGYNATLEQNKIAFDTMLGSADKAGKLLSQLEQFAAKTPFQFPELADASKKMLAFGFNASQVMPILKSVGDAASGLGGGSESLMAITEALGKIQTSGKVSAKEMLELTTNGVPAWQILADKMHLSVAQVQGLTTKGLIPAKTAINDLVSGMEDRFPNMMNKQATSFNGLMSTLKDNIEMTLGGVLKPAFTELTSVILPKAIDLVSKFGEGFKAGGLQGALKAVFPPEIAGTLINIGKGIQLTFGWMESHGPLIKSILVGIGAAFTVYKLAVLASTVATQIHGIILAVSAVRAIGLSAATEAMAANEGGATIAQWALNAALDANPIAIIILAVIALVAGIIYLWNTNEGFRKAVIGVWNAIKDTAISVFNGIKNFFIGIWDWLKSFFGQWGTVILAVMMPFIGIPLLIAEHWNQITSFLSGIWDDIKSAASKAWDGIKSAIMIIVSPIIKGVTNLFNGMKSGLTNIMEGLKKYFDGFWKALKLIFLGPILLICDLVTGNFKKLKEDATKIWDGLKSAFGEIWGGIKQVFTGALEAIAGFLKSEWDGIKNISENVWNELKKFFSDLWNSLKNIAETVWNGIKTFFINFWNDEINGWKRILNTIKDFIVNTFNSVVSFIGSLPGKFEKLVGDIGTAVKNGFNDAINFIKSLPAQAVKWGEDFINGLIDGIKNMAGKVGDAVKGVADKISSILHFSRPDEGPLKDYETWMPDMMSGMAKGVDNSKGNLINSIKGLANNMALSVKGSISSDGIAAVGSGNGYNTANIIIELDGKVLVRVLGQKLVDYIRLKTGVKI